MKQLLTNPVFNWSLIGVISVVLMAVALFYEYALNIPPCVVCVHVRLWVTAVLGLSVAGIALAGRPWAQVVLWLGFLASAIVLVERAWQLLGIENGWILAECGVQTNPGLPAWFPLHDWLPVLYRPETTCGVSPELLFGITMSEGTMAFAVLFTIAAFGGLVKAGATALRL